MYGNNDVSLFWFEAKSKKWIYHKMIKGAKTMILDKACVGSK